VCIVWQRIEKKIDVPVAREMFDCVWREKQSPIIVLDRLGVVAEIAQDVGTMAMGLSELRCAASQRNVLANGSEGQSAIHTYCSISAIWPTAKACGGSPL
jgi:hypothetical protein